MRTSIPGVDDTDLAHRTTVGYLVPASSGFTNKPSGVVSLARATIRAATEAGYNTRLLSPWDGAQMPSVDLVHAFSASASYIGGRRMTGVPWVLSPIHDSTMNAWAYRSAVLAGRIVPRVFTEQAQKWQLYNEVDVLASMSHDEVARIRRQMGELRSKSVVLHCTVPVPGAVSPARLRQVRVELGIPDRYCLAVCDWGAKRKNIRRLLLALEGMPIPLVLAGTPTQGELATEIRLLGGANPNVTLLGFLDQELVTYLMAGAHAYLQPSLEEGAGLAAMEAATYGCSVLSSTRGGSREHLGPSAVYVEPTKVDSIRHGLTQVWKAGRDGTVGQYVVRHRSSEQLPAQLDALYRRLLT